MRLRPAGRRRAGRPRGRKPWLVAADTNARTPPVPKWLPAGGVPT